MDNLYKSSLNDQKKFYKKKKNLFTKGSDSSDDEFLIPSTSARSRARRGRGQCSKRGRGGSSSSARFEEEVFPLEGWSYDMSPSADVTFNRRVGTSEDFKNDDSPLNYLMMFLGLNFFNKLLSSSME